MRARKCDVCGVLYECYDGAKNFPNDGKANGFMLIDKDIYNEYWSRQSFDLCPECMKKLVDFINNRGEK